MGLNRDNLSGSESLTEAYKKMYPYFPSVLLRDGDFSEQKIASTQFVSALIHIQKVMDLENSH